jgi:hypothetical protein
VQAPILPPPTQSLLAPLTELPLPDPCSARSNFPRKFKIYSCVLDRVAATGCFLLGKPSYFSFFFFFVLFSTFGLLPLDFDILPSAFNLWPFIHSFNFFLHLTSRCIIKCLTKESRNWTTSSPGFIACCLGKHFCTCYVFSKVERFLNVYGVCKCMLLLWQACPCRAFCSLHDFVFHNLPFMHFKSFCLFNQGYYAHFPLNTYSQQSVL